MQTVEEYLTTLEEARKQAYNFLDKQSVSKILAYRKSIGMYNKKGVCKSAHIKSLIDTLMPISLLRYKLKNSLGEPIDKLANRDILNAVSTMEQIRSNFQ